MSPLQRHDDFADRRKHLAGLADEELKERFWTLAERIVDPLLQAAATHTTPSIERSIALRMGFTSLEAQALVAGLFEQGLGGHGIGRAILNVMEARGCTAREAGLALIEQKCWNLARKENGNEAHA